MKWFKRVTVLVALMTLALPMTASAFYPLEEAEDASAALDVSIILYSWWEGVWFQASLLGIPFTGVITPTEPLAIDVPGVVSLQIEIIDIDIDQFTFDYEMTGLFELSGVATYAHGIYGLFYNPAALTPMIWSFDLNGLIFNYTDQTRLWVLSNVAGSEGFVQKAAVPGTTDLSFEFPGFLSVDSYVAEFGDTTNTITSVIDGHIGYFVGNIWLPFGFYSFVYSYPPWAP